jgi:hypothetical protein
VTDETRDRAYLTEDEIDKLGEITDTEIYQGELEARANDDQPTETDEENLDLLTATELREGETSDPNVAAEEGLTWVPPIDPPVVPDAENLEDARVASGFGVDAQDEPYDADHRGQALDADDEFESRIREALRADSSTTRYADSLVIGNRGGTVVVRGTVDDVDDTDNISAVISNVAGVDEVVDELDVEGVTNS